MTQSAKVIVFEPGRKSYTLDPEQVESLSEYSRNLVKEEKYRMGTI